MDNPSLPPEARGTGGNRIVIALLAVVLLLLSVDRVIDVWHGGSTPRLILYSLASIVAVAGLLWLLVRGRA